MDDEGNSVLGKLIFDFIQNCRQRQVSAERKLKMSKERTSIVFTGDIGFDRYMEGKWEDETLLSEEILNFFHNADHVLANVEGALIPQEEAEDVNGKGIFFHTMNPEATKLLDKIHADIWNFANNHTMDAGDGGIRNAMRLATEHGAKTLGAGVNVEEASKPVYLEEAGGIGFVGVGYMPTCVRATEDSAGVFGWDELEKIGKVIKQIKTKCRWCVVVSHATEEFTTLPAPYTRDTYLKYLELGADIVVSHHPHVPMNYECVGEKTIFYSLGNFIFDTNYQRVQMNTDTGVLLKIDFTEDTYTFEALGTKIIRGAEKITAGPVADIFTEVSAEEYKRLMPMAAKAFLSNERKRVHFLNPSKYEQYTDEQWSQFYQDYSEGKRVKGQYRDLAVYESLALLADDGRFEKSQLEKVKKYILKQLAE